MNLTKKRKEKELLKKKRENRERLRQDIEDLEAEIRKTETVFNLTTDEYLLESAIFEHNAQKAKMNYLLKLAREIQETKKPAFRRPNDNNIPKLVLNVNNFQHFALKLYFLHKAIQVFS